MLTVAVLEQPQGPCLCWSSAPLSQGLTGTLSPGNGKGVWASRNRPDGGSLPCSNETSASADVEMASGVGSALLEVADAPGAGRGEQDDE